MVDSMGKQSVQYILLFSIILWCLFTNEPVEVAKVWAGMNNTTLFLFCLLLLLLFICFLFTSFDLIVSLCQLCCMYPSSFSTNQCPYSDLLLAERLFEHLIVKRLICLLILNVVFWLEPVSCQW